MLLLSPLVGTHKQTSAESQKAISNVMPRKAFNLASVPNCSLIIWEWRFGAFENKPWKINFSPRGMDKRWCVNMRVLHVQTVMRASQQIWECTLAWMTRNRLLHQDMWYVLQLGSRRTWKWIRGMAIFSRRAVLHKEGALCSCCLPAYYLSLPTSLNTRRSWIPCVRDRGVGEIQLQNTRRWFGGVLMARCFQKTQAHCGFMEEWAKYSLTA